MIILFSGHYHVLDSIDWYSFSCPSLADARPAKRRRTEGTIHTKQRRMFAGSAGRLLARLILVANVREKSILVIRLALLQSRPPRTLHKAAASSVQELLDSVFHNEAAEA
jgi:hypothetical protein